MEETTGSSNYSKCSHFKSSGNEKLCLNLNSLGTFLYKDLGLKEIIDQKVRAMSKSVDFNERYQEPLKLLYQTGKFKNIKKIGDKYELDILKDLVRAYDKEGNWDFVNKLNTNYTDLAELLTELFIRGNIADKLKDKNPEELRSYLLSIKDKLLGVLDKYFSTEDYREFVRNTKHMSNVGERAEAEVREALERFGMKTLYQGGNGDFIDMIFGADLIMGYKGKIYLVQVKASESLMLKSFNDDKYKKVDYFASPTGRGITVKSRDGKVTNFDLKGRIIELRPGIKRK